MARLLTAIVIGAGVAAALICVLTGDLSRMWIAIAAATVVIPLILISTLSGLLPDQTHATPEVIERARAEGRLAPAGVVRVDRTGTEINEVPVYRLELLVDPADRPRYRTTITKRLDATQIHRFLPGPVLAVVRLGADTPDVALLDEDPPRLRYDGSAEAVPVWEKDPDAKVPGKTRPLIPIGRRHRLARRTLFVAAGVAAFVVVAQPFRRDLLLRASDVVTREHAASHVCGEGRAREAIETFRAARGDGTVTSVALYDRWVSITAPVEPGADRYDDFEVRGPRVFRRGAASIQPDPDKEFDLGEIAWDAIPELGALALEQVNGDASQVVANSVHATVSRSAGEAPVLRAYVSTDYESVLVEADADGTPRE